MTCPFLKEAQVKYCGASAVRKLIPLAQTGRAEERCSSNGHSKCPVFRGQPDSGQIASFGTCPYLHESLMQYCGAASVTKFVPYSESLLSRCGNDSYRYCELYLALSHPLLASENVDGLALPRGRYYSANHMWLDIGDDGIGHAGIDAFLGRALGEIDRISYVWQQGHHRPTAVVTVAGIDLEITFPFAMQITGCNLYLRANPRRLTAEPYTGGWLFEGVPDAGALQGLAPGGQSAEWMEDEVRRMSEFLQQLPSPSGPTAADGGMFSAGLAHHIERDQMLALFHEFFSPYASRK